MSSKQTPIIIALAIVVLGVLLYLLGGTGERRYSWKEHFDSKSKDPYGTYLVRNLLQSYFPGKDFKVLADSLNGQLDTGNFVYVGNEFWLDSLDLASLLQFVERGNRAFIACPLIPSVLLDTLDQEECDIYDEDAMDSHDPGDYVDRIRDTAIWANFSHPALSDTVSYIQHFLFFNQAAEHDWDYFPAAYFCDSQTVFAQLGYFNEQHINFVAASYGKGEFYFHTTPLAFTNINLLDRRGLEYASKAFTHLLPGPIYWDERVYDPFSNFAGGGQDNKKSPLRYVLSQPPLAWAWYILLGMALLYLIFRAKRRQRVIPVLEKNANTSLEFIGTIGRLFFLQNNHRQLATQKMRLFLTFIRERYHLPTKELNEHFTKSLAIRSNVPEEHINKIINLNRNINNSGFLSEDTLVDFHHLMERFYRECR